MKIECPEYINTAIKLLENSGFICYAVGGCVRDSIMGKVPNDWDMTTSSTPDETMKVFEEYKTIPTGLKHGTVTVLIGGAQVEITTMRIDGNYSDSRHPESVSFTKSIKNDLARRDFTINAIAYNPKEGIVDPFGGVNDIEKKKIRCVGNPDKRLNEDALRIFRAVRFASVLGFDIEKSTSDSLIKNKALLDNVANERIRVELLKLMQGENVEKVLTDYKSIIFQIIPELAELDGFEQHTPYHIYDIWTHTVKVVANIKNTKELRMAALLHDIGKPEKFTIDENGTGHFKGHPLVSCEKSEVILKRLKFSNEEIKIICDAIRLHDIRPNGTKKQIMHLCSKYSIEAVRNAVYIMLSDAAGQNPEFYDEHIKVYNKALADVNIIDNESCCLKITDLKINGNDLLPLGIFGEKIGQVLKELLEMVLDEKIQNNSDELLSAAKKLI